VQSSYKCSDNVVTNLVSTLHQHCAKVVMTLYSYVGYGNLGLFLAGFKATASWSPD